jgi:uncharacterized metal-binding protein
MMASSDQNQQVFVIPCSGIGKVYGLLSREVVYRVADALRPDQADTVCLALLVSGDAETKQKVRRTPCITVDGCPKLCAMKNVELAGGKVAQSIRVYDTTKRHRGVNFGSATDLSDDGWAVVNEIFDEIVQCIQQQAKV